jgi:hypothetical protein
VSWAALFGAFLLCHLAGDFLLQTDWQALHKTAGLAGGVQARRALVAHAATYTLAFVPALAWIAVELHPATALAAALLIALPHIAVDDGRLTAAWVRRVKRVEGKPPFVVVFGVDQTFHVLALAALALLGTTT